MIKPVTNEAAYLKYKLPFDSGKNIYIQPVTDQPNGKFTVQ